MLTDIECLQKLYENVLAKTHTSKDKDVKWYIINRKYYEVVLDSLKELREIKNGKD